MNSKERQRIKTNAIRDQAWMSIEPHLDSLRYIANGGDIKDIPEELIQKCFALVCGEVLCIQDEREEL